MAYFSGFRPQHILSRIGGSISSPNELRNHFVAPRIYVTALGIRPEHVGSQGPDHLVEVGYVPYSNR
jgi:hypothetical protein